VQRQWQSSGVVGLKLQVPAVSVAARGRTAGVAARVLVAGARVVVPVELVWGRRKVRRGRDAGAAEAVAHDVGCLVVVWLCAVKPARCAGWEFGEDAGEGLERCWAG
jgi:hypothetical protein